MSAPVIVSEPDREIIRAVLRERDVRIGREALDRATMRIRARVSALPYRADTLRLVGPERLGEGQPADERCRDRADELCSAMGTSVEILTRPSRMREIVRLRGAIWTQLNDEGHALAAIGRVFKRDHSTVMYNVQQTRARRGGA
jgi:chromosomal replication initiation ATPase DnaA